MFISGTGPGLIFYQNNSGHTPFRFEKKGISLGKILVHGSGSIVKPL